MKDLSVEAYETMSEDGVVGLFFKTPFCGTCQLAEQLLNLTFQALDGKGTPTYMCRAGEWEEYLSEWRIESVPCLIFVKDGQVLEKLYAFESVTKLYQLYQHYQ
ncbi:thioredoxin-like protein YusE [Pullulanibacillus camelliae]|uniref:Thioredoxin-like protein YusE n=1 Tax=Pullulanibacillus camelliae TaxID=1707096 RepID=A0A8J3DXG5_9BACL|nr:thioredoxin family protein [Pullulanibacillus camelliae]GGE48375.1 thioredoxin-like protein YusE [Pullulanibacillus camelliae]